MFALYRSLYFMSFNSVQQPHELHVLLPFNKRNWTSEKFRELDIATSRFNLSLTSKQPGIWKRWVHGFGFTSLPCFALVSFFMLHTGGHIEHLL